MLTVHKYNFPFPADTFELHLPEGARVLHVGMQGDDPRMWVLVDPKDFPTPRRFRVVGTGVPIEQSLEDWRHISTFFMGEFVWHVFEEMYPEGEK